jgi:hypothetical protein
MKVMIVKCTNPSAWWNKSKYIGAQYEVIRELDEDYLVKVKDKKREGNHVLKADCAVIEK